MGNKEYAYHVELICEHMVISTLLITDIEPDSNHLTIIREACAKIDQSYGIDPYDWVIYFNIEHEGSLL